MLLIVKQGHRFCIADIAVKWSGIAVLKTQGVLRLTDYGAAHHSSDSEIVVGQFPHKNRVPEASGSKRRLTAG
jgi:hypothetical protein